MSAVNTYDEYGIPATTNMGRFGFTGQAYLPEVGLNYYKARIYSPTLGRFMQSDPIGYGDGVNFYDYVGGDPVNGRDPSGLFEDEIVVTGKRNNGRTVSAGDSIAGYWFGLPFNAIAQAAQVENSGSVELTIDESCDDVPIVNDPKAQQLARDILNRSTRAGLSNGREEWAFWGSETFFGGYDYDEPFTDHQDSQVDVATRRSNTLWSWMNGNHEPRYFFHSHPNNPKGSRVSDRDITLTREMGAVAISIDLKGNVTCGK